MTMKVRKFIVYLLVFDLYVMQALGHINSDPAPGRSPGPPAKLLQKTSLTNLSPTSNMEHSLGKRSNITSFNAEYHQVLGYQKQQNQEKEFMAKKIENLTNVTSNQEKPFSTSSLLSSQYFLKNSLNRKRSILTTVSNNNTTTATTAQTKLATEAASSPCRWQLENFFRNATLFNIGDTQRDANTNRNEQSPRKDIPQLKIHLELQHDIFNTSTKFGINCGLLYRVHLVTAISPKSAPFHRPENSSTSFSFPNEHTGNFSKMEFSTISMSSPTSSAINAINATPFHKDAFPRIPAYYSVEFMVESISALSSKERGSFVNYSFGSNYPLLWTPNISRRNENRHIFAKQFNKFEHNKIKMRSNQFQILNPNLNDHASMYPHNFTDEYDELEEISRSFQQNIRSSDGNNNYNNNQNYINALSYRYPRQNDCLKETSVKSTQFTSEFISTSAPVYPLPKKRKCRRNTKSCPDNKWISNGVSYINTDGSSSAKFSNLWLINELCEIDDIIEFKVIFRLTMQTLQQRSTNITTNNRKSNISGKDNLNERTGHVVPLTLTYKKIFRFKLHKSCRLVLKETMHGVLNYAMLPLYCDDCLVHFPTYKSLTTVEGIQLAWTQSRNSSASILVELQRLNVPCSSGSYIRFSGHPTICGKLEELAKEQRIYYFNIHYQASVQIYRNPMFSLIFKFVDYCYNIPFSNKTGEFYITSNFQDFIECNFRIHLPYGNRILLKLVTNNNSEIYFSEVDSSMGSSGTRDQFLHKNHSYNFATRNGNRINSEFINFTLANNSNYHVDDINLLTLINGQYLNANFTEQSHERNRSVLSSQILNKNYWQMLSAIGSICAGIEIKVFENNSTWTHCINDTNEMRGFILESSFNTLNVQIVRRVSKKLNASNFHKEATALAKLTSVYLAYESQPLPEIASNCAFGWILMQKFCIAAFAIPLSWMDAEHYCSKLDGHLVSIRSEQQQKTVNELLIHSNEYSDNNAYWVGASDKSYEGDFRWSDGFTFQYTNWFPGWFQHENYNKQPNDDGLSNQDCIELRRYFRTPHGTQTHRNHLTNTFMWNDRDCNAKNYLICEKAIDDGSYQSSWLSECNKTVSLSKEYPRASIWSPSFPRKYPDNVNCFTTIIAPKTYRIIIEFEELVIENEPGCSYDYLEITEPHMFNPKTTKKSSKYRKSLILNDKEFANSLMLNNNKSDLMIDDPINTHLHTLSDGTSAASTTFPISSMHNLYQPLYGNNTYEGWRSVLPNYLSHNEPSNNYNNYYSEGTNYKKLIQKYANLYGSHINFIEQTSYPKRIPFQPYQQHIRITENKLNQHYKDDSYNYNHNSNYSLLQNINNKVLNSDTYDSYTSKEQKKTNINYHENNDDHVGIEFRYSNAYRINNNHIPKRLCGDWSRKLKLLRYVSSDNIVGLNFVSDYSHHFGGYKAKTYMENTATECPNEHLKLYNDYCYLFVSYPEVDWWTAKNICRGMGAILTSVATAEEQSFITLNIRNQIDYSPQSIYWLGGQLQSSGHFEWIDGTKMDFKGWLPGQGHTDAKSIDTTCLSLQWKVSPKPLLASGLYWIAQKCSKIGGYICKKRKVSASSNAYNTNFIVTGREGRLMSPAYPDEYPINIDYKIHIKSPARTRIIVQFQKLDLEAQDECLYDYVSLLDYNYAPQNIRDPSSNILAMPISLSTGQFSGNMLPQHYDYDDKEHFDMVFNEQMLAIDAFNIDIYNESISNKQIPLSLRRLHSHPITKAVKYQRNREKKKRRKRSSFSQISTKNSFFHSQQQHSFFYLQRINKLLSKQKNHTTAGKQMNHKKANYKKKSINEKQVVQGRIQKTIKSSRGDTKDNSYIPLHMFPKYVKTNPEIRKRRSTVLGSAVNHIDNAQSFLPYVRWCGTHDTNMSKFDFVSNSNEVLMNFHSDFSISGLGFAAIWKAVDISGCPLRTITAHEGTIFSPNYPHFLLNHLDCVYVIQAPIRRRVWLEFSEFDFCSDALMEVDTGNGYFRPFQLEKHLNDGLFVSLNEQLRVRFVTGKQPRGKGFHATYHTVELFESRERVINFTRHEVGFLYQLNFPDITPNNTDLTQHLVAPFGYNILLELHGVVFAEKSCADSNLLEIYDNYADNNGTNWKLCNSHNVDLAISNLNISEYSRRSFASSIDNYTSNIIYQKNGNDTVDMNNNKTDKQLKIPSATLADYFLNDKLTTMSLLQPPPPVYITSYLNTLHIRHRITTATFKSNAQLNCTIQLQRDSNYKIKIVSSDKSVESCNPNPCQYNGKCVIKNNSYYCQCFGHFTGRFCGLNLCELEPCIFGKCELTSNNFKCKCQPGYMGITCEQKQRPCADNPCEGRGICYEKNGGFICRCYAWWEGARCEKRMLHIPYKPLSERMLQEPFWLGLITVFVVLAIIGLIWCAKRHFPEKIEKLLTDDTGHNRPAGNLRGHHHHTSLREQLQFTSAMPQGTPVNNVGAATSRSIFNRLGIRKPSILSLSSPNPLPNRGGATARTFSLDDLLRPPPRRSPSPRKKRNNSTPVKKSATDKTLILQHLVKPRVNFSELISLTECRLPISSMDFDKELKETNLSETIESLTPTPLELAIDDPKLEKKVTFVRLLNKLSQEMSSSSEPTRNSSANSLPTDLQIQTNSTIIPSSSTNGIRSLHNMSPCQDSDSLSSSEAALTDVGVIPMFKVSETLTDNHQNSSVQIKESGSDSIFVKFRNLTGVSATTLTSTNDITNTQPSSTPVKVVLSPSITPISPISSPPDDRSCDDESSTSSIRTQCSYANIPPDSPLFYRQIKTIEVPVLDVLNAHKNSSFITSIYNHPPTILLEVPSSSMNNKCLSPIREMPTPIPSPNLTPIMPRPQTASSLSQKIYCSSADELSDNEEIHFNELTKELLKTSQNIRKSSKIVNLEKTEKRKAFNIVSPTSTVTCEPHNLNNLTEMIYSSKHLTFKSIGNADYTPNQNTVVPPAIVVNMELIQLKEKTQISSQNPIIPTLTVEQASPKKGSHQICTTFGSPPPQRATIAETNSMLPCKYQQKRLLRHLEKPLSLDYQFEPPLVTVTSNFNELESDIEPLSPATKISTGGGLMPPNSVGMCYLSPFSMCTRTDRTISESNLSSSGYSSMASAGPSRCGSSNPLYSNDIDETSTGASGTNSQIHANLLNRRRYSALPSCKENICNGQNFGSNSEHNLHKHRNRSDSETYSDDILMESNDEGICTDLMEEKFHKVLHHENTPIDDKIIIEVQQAAPPTPPLSVAVEAVSTANTDLRMTQLQLPAIVVQNDTNVEKSHSPMSSRSESPLSERLNIDRFSPQFYGHKDQLPFTDSDGLYDFPSSDGKTNCALIVTHPRRNNNRKRDRKLSKCTSNQSQTKQQFELLTKEMFKPTSCNTCTNHNCSKCCHSSHHPCPSINNTTRKSPKRRSQNRLPITSSSSSSESLHFSNELGLRHVSKLSVGNSPKREKRLRNKQGSLSDTSDGVTDALLKHITPNMLTDFTAARSTCKINRLRAIANQIRFLRRLEKSIKNRENSLNVLQGNNYHEENNTDYNDSPQISSPLLQHQTRSPLQPSIALCKQKRLPGGPFNLTSAALHAKRWKSLQECYLIVDDLNSD